jgi:hypothetical protein
VRWKNILIRFIVGGIAVSAFAALRRFIKRFRLSGLVATALAGLGWLVSAGGLYWLFLRRA